MEILDKVTGIRWRVPTAASAAPPTPLVPRPPAASIQQRGPELWRRLHQRPREATGDDTAWLDAFARELCCDCKAHWQAWVKGNPPDFSSPLAYFAWTFAAHNAVSRRLQKREWTIDEAMKVWGYASD